MSSRSRDADAPVATTILIAPVREGWMLTPAGGEALKAPPAKLGTPERALSHCAWCGQPPSARMFGIFCSKTCAMEEVSS